MTRGCPELVPADDAQIVVDGQVVTVVRAIPTDTGADVFVLRATGTSGMVSLTCDQLAAAAVPDRDGGGNPRRALAALWGLWMRHAIPRIRSAVLATRPLEPFAHQDEAVFRYMLRQPRLRFLLGDEPGTGKTIMSGMYLAEAMRRGLLPGNTVIVVPAHLVEKWIRDLRRYFAITAKRITPEIARDPADLDPRYRVWLVSLDLYAYNSDVKRKVAGTRSSWSLAIFDEAHRLTPTSRLLESARDLTDRAHHLLLLTATPHRGNEWFWRGLLNLLDDERYPWSATEREFDRTLRPSRMSFLRRMKEDLKDRDGKALFPPRYAQTVPVTLAPLEQAGYDDVMGYVDEWYGANAVLARSIYGKRAASSLVAALATIQRRYKALQGPAGDLTEPLIDAGLDDRLTGRRADTAALEDDDAWQQAEDAVVAARSKDKKAEQEAISHVMATLRLAIASSGEPAKWTRCKALLADHGIAPDHGQVLVFSEFTDTVEWLAKQFRTAGYSARTLTGQVGHQDRDRLQQDFLAGKFQVLVSTDAGGEGIDLQSAHVMVDWDIPWSLVRLEQRMGRLHRIGQRNAVHVYHLVAPGTREGRVQEVMLTNMERAAESLGGRIFDLMDATAARADFDWTKALVDAQRDKSAALDAAESVPDVDVLVDKARQQIAEDRILRTSTNTAAAEERFRADRLEAINPVIVEAFTEAVAAAQDWAIGIGPYPGIRKIRAGRTPLPLALGGGSEGHVAADGRSIRQAIAEGARDLDDVIVLGPTEEAFAELVTLAVDHGAQELLRGVALDDPGSLTNYTLLAYTAGVESHDGVNRGTVSTPVLIRYSGAGAFEVAWESLMKVRPADPARVADKPAPAARAEGDHEARRAVRREVERQQLQRSEWVGEARDQLVEMEYRLLDEWDDLPPDERATRKERFDRDRIARLAMLAQMETVTSRAPRFAGWSRVHGTARAEQLGYDPDSEHIAVATVLAELERLGYDVDDRQTAGVGYDLLARNARTQDQRLIEVKGFHHDLAPVWMEANEWMQARQRGSDYWLYVVTECATMPIVAARIQDPAGTFTRSPRKIERFQISARDLRQAMEGHA
jgi:superfamily II DNA or RNA helicase